MTIIERIKKATKTGFSPDADSMDKLIMLAYYFGREEATKEVSDEYVRKLQAIKYRAEKSRYHKMARKIVGDCSYIYFPDYAQDMLGTFGSDETTL